MLWQLENYKIQDKKGLPERQFLCLQEAFFNLKY